MPKVPVKRSEFGPKTYGLDTLVNDRYLGIVVSGKEGFGPVCYHPNSTKQYFVLNGEYTVRELNLGKIDETQLKSIIEANQDKIKEYTLSDGESAVIPEGVIHQVFGKGTLIISAPGIYRREEEHLEISLFS